MTNLLPTIVPKSDQLNSDDLIGRSLTIKVTKVLLCEAPDQPVAIHFEGDNGKPFKPCKSMRRLLVHVWKGDGNQYVGRRMTLYRDEKVAFGGLQVGGIRISHLSDIDQEITVALTATRGNKKPYTVKPLRDAPQEPRSTAPTDDNTFPGDRPRSSTTRTAPAANNGGADGGTPLPLSTKIEQFYKRMGDAASSVKATAIWNVAKPLRDDVDRADPERLPEMEAFYEERLQSLQEAERQAAMADAR